MVLYTFFYNKSSFILTMRCNIQLRIPNKGKAYCSTIYAHLFARARVNQLQATIKIGYDELYTIFYNKSRVIFNLGKLIFKERITTGGKLLFHTYKQMRRYMLLGVVCLIDVANYTN